MLTHAPTSPKAIHTFIPKYEHKCIINAPIMAELYGIMHDLYVNYE